MQPYNILITKTKYDEKTGDELNPDILFGPQIIFAESQKGVVKKAVILSQISADEIENVNIYIDKFSYISNYGEVD